jgi:hypothetical protein
MKHLKTFESYESSMGREEMINHLCQCGWEKHELEGMHEDELEKMCWETEPKDVTESKEISEKKWIQDAIKHPGALRKSMGKKEGEKLTKSEINKELSKLKAKDKDKEKPGVQLGASDAKKYKRLNLAKTLRKFK